MFEESVYTSLSNKESKLNQVEACTQYVSSTEVLDSTKKTHYSSESKYVNASQSFLNLKFGNRSMHKCALEYLDMEEYIDSMDLKNKTKCALSSQLDQQEFLKMSKFISDSENNNKLPQGDILANDEQESSLGYSIDSNSLDNVDVNSQHSTNKVNAIDYNNNNVDERSYKDLEHASQANVADQNESIDIIQPEHIFSTEVKMPGFHVLEDYKSHNNNTSTAQINFNHQTQVKQQNYKHESENINQPEHIYFDKLEYNKKYEPDKKKRKQVGEMFFFEMPMTDIEKSHVTDTSELKPSYYCNSSIYPIILTHKKKSRATAYLLFIELATV